MSDDWLPWVRGKNFSTLCGSIRVVRSPSQGCRNLRPLQTQPFGFGEGGGFGAPRGNSNHPVLPLNFEKFSLPLNSYLETLFDTRCEFLRMMWAGILPPNEGLRTLEKGQPIQNLKFSFLCLVRIDGFFLLFSEDGLAPFSSPQCFRARGLRAPAAPGRPPGPRQVPAPWRLLLLKLQRRGRSPQNPQVTASS